MKPHDRTGAGVAFDECARCGRPLESDTWQPVRTVEEGSLSFVAFCDDDGRNAYDAAAG